MSSLHLGVVTGQRHGTRPTQSNYIVTFRAVVVYQVLQAGKRAVRRDTVAIVRTYAIVFHNQDARGAPVDSLLSCEHGEDKLLLAAPAAGLADNKCAGLVAIVSQKEELCAA